MDNWDEWGCRSPESDTNPTRQRGNWRPALSLNPFPRSRIGLEVHPPDSVVLFMIHTTFFPPLTTMRLVASRYIYTCSVNHVAANLIHDLMFDSFRHSLESRLQPAPHSITNPNAQARDLSQSPSLPQPRPPITNPNAPARDFPNPPRLRVRVSGEQSQPFPAYYPIVSYPQCHKQVPTAKKVKNILEGYFQPRRGGCDAAAVAATGFQPTAQPWVSERSASQPRQGR